MKYLSYSLQDVYLVWSLYFFTRVHSLIFTLVNYQQLNLDKSYSSNSECIIIIQLQLVADKDMQSLKSSPKKIYQYILSAKQPSEELRECLVALLRRTIESPEHFDFLLHRVNWFQAPLSHYQDQLLKILRIYRSHSKQSPKVIYNLIIESLINPNSNQQALHCLGQIFEESYDKRNIIHCLKQNYPHKLCNLESHSLYLKSMVHLCKTFKKYRADLLEIVIQNLINFDTQMITGDQWVHKPFPDDQKIVQLRENNRTNELSLKFDSLLHYLLIQLKELMLDDQIMNDIFLVFQSKILPIKTTKLIQFIVFAIAESSKARSSSFISFLLGNVFDNRELDMNGVGCRFNYKQNWYRIFTQSNFYLFSYILRSKQISKSMVPKILAILIEKFRQRLKIIKQVDIDESTDLKQLFHSNQISLIILQTIIMVKLSSHITDPNVSQMYETLINQAHFKLHLQYFLHQQILEKMNLNKKDNRNNLIVKFSNKFLPCTVPLTASLIDPLLRVCSHKTQINLQKDLQQFEPRLRKMHKGETPISNCSDTIVV